MPTTTRTPTGCWISLGADANRHEESSGRRRIKVLVPVNSAHHAPTLIRTAAAFARVSCSEVLALHVLSIPPQLPLSEAAQSRTQARSVVQAVQRMREQVLDVPIRIVLTAGRCTDDVVVAATRHDDIQVAILPWEPDRQPVSPRDMIDVDRVMRRAACQVLALRQQTPGEAPRRIVMAVRPGNPAVHTAAPAVALVRQHDVPVRLLTVLPDDVDRAAEIETRMWLTRLDGELTAAGIPHRRLQRTVLTGNHLGTALTDHTEPEDLILLGAPSGLHLFPRLRVRRLVRSIAGINGTVAVYRPEAPPTLTERVVDLVSWPDQAGRQP